MTTDDRDERPVADKDDLRRAVEDKVAQAEVTAGSEPVVNAPPPAPAEESADNSVTANPVVAPAPVAEPGDAAAAPAPQPGPPSPDPAEPNTPQVTEEGDG